jgi:hypothetical protein
MQFGEAVAEISGPVMACISLIRLDFPDCENQPLKAKFLQKFLQQRKSHGLV